MMMTEERPLLTRSGETYPHYDSGLRSSDQTQYDQISPVESTKRKWLMLFLFCMLSFLQSAAFVAWNPIANSAVKAFGPEWTSSTMAWQVNLATIPSPIFQWPVWKAIHKFDLSRVIRWGAAFPLVIATGLQFLPVVSGVSPETYKWLSFVSFVLIGIVGVVFFSSITRFSSLWFPTNQRTTATGLTCTFLHLGALLPAIVGPVLVSDPNVTPVSSEVLRREIGIYLSILFALCFGLFVSMFFYFPSENRTTRISDGDADSTTVKSSLGMIFSRKNVVLTILVYGLSSLVHVWGSTLLTLTLSPIRVSQASVGVMTSVTIVVTSALTVILSRIADTWFKRRLKFLLMVILPIHALLMIAFVIFVLNATSHPNFKVLISVLYVLSMSTLNCAAPLLFELGCEMSHPVSEEIVGGCFDQVVNILSVCFHSFFTYIASSAENFNTVLYLLMFLPSLVFVCFVFVEENYKRSESEESNDSR